MPKSWEANATAIKRMWSALLGRWRADPVAARVAELESIRCQALETEVRLLRAADETRAGQVAKLSERAAHLEDRLLSYWRYRWDAIDQLADYLAAADVPGDYIEFGVYRGTTFGYAYQLMAPLFAAMKFVAADSFEGLPSPQGVDALDGFTSKFFAGQFACSEQEFRRRLDDAGVDWQRVVIVKGWFEHSLTEHSAQLRGMTQVAAAWIDCDLYESTIPVLEFVTPRLSVGSVLLFDDWRCFRNLPDRGQQRACREWLETNPQIVLRDFTSFGFGGRAFTVSAC